MLSIAVVDDEPVFSDALCRMIRQFAAKENLEMEITCFQDGIDIADEFRSRWDIIFLDIQKYDFNTKQDAPRRILLTNLFFF